MCATTNVSVTSCSSDGGTVASVSGEYAGNGGFMLSGTNFPSSETSCQYQMVKYAGSWLESPYTASCADTTKTGKFIPGYLSYPSGTFVFGGATYGVRRQATVSGSICYSPTTIFTATKCTDESNNEGSLAVSFTSSGEFTAYVINKPVSDYASCKVYATQYGDTSQILVSQSTGASSCESASFTADDASATYGVGKTYKFTFAAFDATGAQVCASSETSISECSYSGSHSSVSGIYLYNGTFILSGTNFASTDGSCDYQIVQHAGNSLLKNGSTPISSSCIGVSKTGQIQPDTSIYTFLFDKQ